MIFSRRFILSVSDSLCRSTILCPVVRRLSTTTTTPIESLHNRLALGDRAALSKAITLVESTLPKHRKQSEQLLSLVLETLKRPRKKRFAGALPSTFRIGFSGAPGVGKSSFIETFGMFLLSKGYKLAVLAVDPSSTKTGGSILGDRTRMTELSRAANAYVRPSPSSGTLGGVARNTNEVMLLCEAAGYDIVFIETVGVGQSETMVADMVDMFVLLVAPGAGDELQGMKKGVVELSDLIVVNKSDGSLLPAARTAQMEYTSALKFLQPNTPNWSPMVLPVSSHEKTGMKNVWETMLKFYHHIQASEYIYAHRGAQQKKWMWKQITEMLLSKLQASTAVRHKVKTLEERVYNGDVPFGIAAEEIIKAFLRNK